MIIWKPTISGRISNSFMIEIIEKLFISVIASLIIKKIKKLVPKKIEKKPEFDLHKNYLLDNICCLYEIPKFNIDNPTMNKELLTTLYEVSIDLLLKFHKSDKNNIEYIASNYSIKTNDVHSLIDFLEKELRSPSRNDGRYRMGFRSVYILISNNLEEIEVNELKDILNKLTPFFKSYVHKEYLNHHAA